MIPFTHLTPTLAVAGQLEPHHFAAIAALGFRTIINNRPDGERGDYIVADEAAKLAAAHDLDYHHIPVDHRGPMPDIVRAFAGVLDNNEGPLLAHCRTGHRTTVLWALASAGRIHADEILRKGAEAGFDLTALYPVLTVGAAAPR